MLLTRDEATLFFKLHGSLMQFVNDQLQVITGSSGPIKFSTLSPPQRKQVVAAFLGRRDLLDAYVSANPAGLAPQEMDIIHSWRDLVAGKFIVLRQLQKYAILLPNENDGIAYGVLGIADPLEFVIGPSWPAIVETVLLPFQGRIIYDGLMSRYNISFGPGARGNFEDSYRTAKKLHGIVTGLPFMAGAAKKAPAFEKPQLRPKRASTAPPAKAALDEIVAMTDGFCRAHLNEEYAGLCRKLAESLARKRPSPFLGGRAEVWACGIVRTIGWVNFLDDRSKSPFMKLTAIDKAFGVAESSGQGKSKAIRQLLGIRTFDHHWTLPSQCENNPLIWMLDVDGFIVDIRNESVAMQRAAFSRGLIPYIPAERQPEVNAAAGPKTGRLFQFKITLRDIQPTIWRRIQVTDCTLDKLHEHIQIAMGWTNSHLHEFVFGERRFGDPELLGDEVEPFEDEDSTKTLISAVVPRDGGPCQFDYVYDFGDSWEHEVSYEGSPSCQPGTEYPLCLEGERACPPEDVGGPSGYAEYLQALADPAHEQHGEMLAWGGQFDPKTFDPQRATQAMQEGLPDWRKTV